MIILPNKNEKYVKEMNSLIFSHDIEEQIMSNILKHKKKNINIYIYMVALMLQPYSNIRKALSSVPNMTKNKKKREKKHTS